MPFQHWVAIGICVVVCVVWSVSLFIRERNPNAVQEIRARFAVLVGGSQVKLWRRAYEGPGLRERLDESEKVLGFKGYEDAKRSMEAASESPDSDTSKVGE